jgi:type I restriction enzyme S subunit
MNRLEESLPSGWSYPKIKDVIKKFQNGYAFSATGYVNSGIPIITMGSIQLDGNFKKNNKKIKYWEENTREELSRYIIKKESLIMAMTDVTPTMELIGRSCIVKGEGEFYLNQRVGWIDTDESKVSKDFLSYLTNYTDWRKYCITSSGLAAQANLSTVQILEGRVKLPPIAQQQKIAKILSTVDNLIEKTQTLIDKYTAIKQGMMADLFTRGIDMTTGDTSNSKGGKLRPSVEDAPELYKQTQLGWVPKEWEVRLLSEVVDQKRPIVYGILMPGTGVIEGVPVIKVRDIKGGVVIEDGLLITSHKIDQQYRRSKVKQGDLLYTIRGTVGRLAKVTKTLDGANITQDTARVAITKGDEDFYMAYLDSHGCRVFSEINTLGVAVQGINLGALRQMPVVNPPLLEQQRIKERSLGIERLISKEKKYVEELKKQKKGLMQDLLTGRVKVQ